MKTKFYSILLFLLSFTGFAQTGIGTYSALDGGFENHTSTLAGATGGILVLNTSLWTASTTASIVRTSSATGGRTGPRFVSLGATNGTAKLFYSPQIAGAFAPNTTYQVQFWYKSASTTTLDASSVDLYVDNNAANPAGTKQSVPVILSPSISTWTKVAVAITTNTTVALNNGVAGFTIDAPSAGYSADFDDFVIYQSNDPDTTAPNSPGAISATGTSGGGSSVSWGAASGGVDGGGYLVVRYATTSPSATDDPLQNGIYKIGNTIAGGGIVRYIGTSTSFNDTGLSPGVDYYYKVYTVDKAFNYSDESVTNSAVQALATTYYYKGSGLLTDLANWGLNTDGTGTSPADFTAASQVFEIRNTSAVTLDGTWTVGSDPANGTKIRLGNSSESAITLTLNLGSSIGPAGTGNFDVMTPISGNQKVVYKNTTAISFGNILDANFEVNYDGVTVISASTKSFGTVSLINGANVTFTATPVIKNILVDPTSILTTPSSASSAFITIPSGGSVIINGTIKVPKLSGFVSSNVGTPNDTFGALQFVGTENLTLGNNSTVEYVRTATGMQYITARSDYKNLILSGSTPKNINGPTFVSGTFTINQTGAAAVTLAGNLSVNGSLTQTSGKLTLGAFTLTMNGGYQGDATNSLVGSASSNLTTTGTTGTLYFDQTSPGTTNIIKNLTLSSGTATLGNTLNITAGSSSGTVIVASGATLNTGDFLTLKSDANGTASVGNSAGTISGNVTVERCIPSGKRAFRLLSPAVTTTTFISGNWQGQTHITGGLGATGLGFDATETNNPSMYTYDNQAAQGVSGWTPILNTNATNLIAGVGYRVLIRGDKTPANITSASANDMNAAITLSATGTLKTGTVPLSSSSTPSINNTTNSVTNGYSLVGNPYQSAVDWNAVTKTDIDVTYWAWDPNMGTSTQRGRYVSFNGSTNSVLDGAGSPLSYVGQFIQPGQAFFVKNTGSTAGTLTFEEADKATTSANVFRTANTPSLGVALYDPNELAIGGYPIDATKAVFSSEYTNELGLGDAAKLEAAGENIAWFRNNTKLAIDAAAPVTTSDELAMKTMRLGANKNYTFKIQTTNFDNALTPYLVDTFLNTQTEIATSQAFLASFATTSNQASYSEDRFKIVFQTSALSADDFVKNIKLYPNPAKAGGSFYVDGITEATVSVYNVVGQTIPVTVMSQGNAIQVTPSASLSKGVYLVSITTQGITKQVKWIVE